jgi:SAM-dependent methyltransferase
MRRGEYQWPKQPPALSSTQEQAREAFMMAWHEELPSRYALLERFNHTFVTGFGTPPGTRTLEIGAGIGSHLSFEDLANQEYYALEYRAEFCERLAAFLPPERILHGSIEDRQPFPDGSFDRVIAIHVLEHLRNLPAALQEVARLLRPGGVFDVVLPTEGGLAYGLARKISAERMFRRRFRMDYTPIVRNEHVNTFGEVESLLHPLFRREHARYFPLGLPSAEINLVVGERLRRLAP